MLQEKPCYCKPLTFKQFSRKSYAVFNSLHKEVRIGVMGIMTLGPACIGQVSAQSLVTEGLKTKNVQELTETEVIGTRAPLATDQAARIVTTITRDEIQRAAVQSINDVLKLAAGVDVRQRSGFGVQSDISINGGTFDQITILLNGVCINNPQTGHLTADFPVSLESIERIEILEGAAGRVFGSQAFSGAINIVTRQDSQNHVEIHGEGGSYGTIGGEGNGTWNIGRWSHNLNGGYRRSDGGTTNSDFKQIKGFYQGNYLTSDVKVNWQAGVTSQDYGANTFYSASYPDQWEANRRYILSIGAETKGKIRFTPMVSWLRSTDHFQLIRGTHTGENFHRGDVFTAALSAWSQWSLGKTAVGAEIRQEGILSTNLGRPLDESNQVPISGENNLFYNHRDNRTNISYYVEHNLLLKNWTVSLGILANRNTALDERFRWYPGVDISFRPGTGWTLFASWNKALRLPTFTDLYYKSPTQEGNIGLKPEETSSFKIGIRKRYTWLSAEINTFYNRGSNMIDWVMYNAADKYHSTNFKLDNYGISLQTKANLSGLSNGNFPITQITASYAYIYQRRHDDTEIYKSNYALEYLRHKLVVTLDHRIWRELSMNWTLRWQDRMGAYILYNEGKTTGELVPYSPYALLDAQIMWNKPAYRLYVSLNNLTNHKYYDLGNIRQPGFCLMAGINWRFNL